MNTENLTPAQRKAIEAGGTNNAVIGGSLVKRGIMDVAGKIAAEIMGMKYVLSVEYIDAQKEANRKEKLRDGIATLPTPEKVREEAIREVAKETGESAEIVAEMFDSLVSMDEEEKLIELEDNPDAAYEPEEIRRPLETVELPDYAEPLPAPTHPRDRVAGPKRPVIVRRAVITPTKHKPRRTR